MLEDNETSQLTIAVVEDEPAVLDAFQMVLTKASWRVLLCARAEALFAWLDTGEAIDCVLMDPNLPGMNGAEAVALLQHRYPALPVIGISASPDGPLAHATSRAGARVMLAKPVNAAKLVATIAGLFR